MSLADLHNPDLLADCERSDSEIILVILSEAAPLGAKPRGLCARLQAASHFRSRFGGDVWLLTSLSRHLFQLRRAGYHQILVPDAAPRPWGCWAQREQVAEELRKVIEAKRGCYVIVADAAGVALRNLEHLIPRDSSGVFSTSAADLYWTDVCGDLVSSGTPRSASPGLWAVKGEHFESVLQSWCEQGIASRGRISEVCIWSKVIHNSPLSKSPFEKGEIYAPTMEEIDWNLLGVSAFVTVPDWPEKEQWKFLQTLYFGTYFGDETGLMLNILDP